MKQRIGLSLVLFVCLCVLAACTALGIALLMALAQMPYAAPAAALFAVVAWIVSGRMLRDEQ